MRRTPLRARSKKRQRLYQTERIPLVVAMLEDAVCERCQTARATDVHEIKSRARGGSITDLDNLAALCRPCHSFITENPYQAAAEGWSRASWA